jgi:hypothetical protein
MHPPQRLLDRLLGRESCQPKEILIASANLDISFLRTKSVRRG